MPKLGVEFYQVFPGVFDWGPNDPSDEQVKEAMDWARQNGVRMGDYSGCNSVFCGHYNQHRNSLAGTGIEPCFGNAKFVDWYSARVVAAARKFGFEEHCLDFLALDVCNNPNHGHPTGEESIYHQIKGLCDLMERIDSVSPQMLIWPNSGCWADLLPKVAWYAPSQYLTDPYIFTPWQGLNMTRLLDDSRREQMVTLHYCPLHSVSFLHQLPVFLLPELRGPGPAKLPVRRALDVGRHAEPLPWRDQAVAGRPQRKGRETSRRLLRQVDAVPQEELPALETHVSRRRRSGPGRGGNLQPRPG